MDNIKLLVCDDDNNICELLRLYLVKEGYSVVLAQSGTEALSLFHKERPDMVLLDIMMPGGGYCFAPTHLIQDNSPLENVLEMYRCAREFGRC